MFYLFAFFIAFFSAMLGRSYGLAGMLAPWIAVGLVYWLVDTALLGMIALAENVSSRPD
jgi:lipopolysaccharide export LptBFGC system permease protein LptF